MPGALSSSSAPRSVSFGGAVFAWPYHAGVAAFLEDRGTHRALDRIYGASSGAVVATMLACGVPMREGLELGLRADAFARTRLPVLRPRAFLAAHIAELDGALPADAHVRAHGRLHVAVRQVRTWRRLHVSDFPTRAALLDALAGAVAIPGLTCRLVHRSPVHGALVDVGPGVPRDDRPEARSITVSVHPARSGIAPARRMAHSLWLTVVNDDARRTLFSSGYEDARRYFL